MQHSSGEVSVPVPPAVNAIEELFTYHAPEGDQPDRYKRIRDAAKVLALTVWDACPPGPDRTASIRLIREAVMTANASIATRNAAAFLK